MKISDILAICARNLTRRKFRTFLTVMGVVIGTCSIVVMISLGIGISAAQEAMFENIGDITIIDVMSQGSSTQATLNDEAVAQIDALNGVLVATPFMELRLDNTWVELLAGKKGRYSTYVGWGCFGVKLEALELLGYTAAQGTTIHQTDDKKIQLLFGNKYVYNFEDTKKKWPNNMVNSWEDENGNLPDPFFNPLEETFYSFKVHPSKEGAKELTFDAEVVGIIASGKYDQKAYNCFMDIQQMQRIKKTFEKENGIKKDKTKKEQYDTVKVKVTDVKLMGEVQTAIEAMGFRCESMQSYREEMEKSTNQIQMILAILGGVSLFVAAISITNTMIMSVYERTREIGVMKVLGCLVSNIRTIFLVEAGLIGFFGGVMGILISYLLSFLLNTFGGSLGSLFGYGYTGDSATKLSIIPPWLVLLGILFATLIGIVSGFQPANRAVGISALEAIKTE